MGVLGVRTPKNDPPKSTPKTLKKGFLGVFGGSDPQNTQKRTPWKKDPLFLEVGGVIFGGTPKKRTPRTSKNGVRNPILGGSEALKGPLTDTLPARGGSLKRSILGFGGLFGVPPKSTPSKTPKTAFSRPPLAGAVSVWTLAGTRKTA